jgi:hypothetical protein
VILWLGIQAAESSAWVRLAMTLTLGIAWWVIGSRWFWHWWMQRIAKGCWTNQLTIRDDIIDGEFSYDHPDPKRITQRHEQFAWADVRSAKPFWKGFDIEYHGGRHLYIPDAAFASGVERAAVRHRAEACLKR